MAVGSPSINTPNALDLRAIQTAIANTRSRIEQLETLFRTASSTATSGTGAVSLANVLNQITQLRSQLTTLQAQVDALGSLTTQIEALPFSSGVTDDAEVAVVIAGVGVRVHAGDIARLAAVAASTDILATQVFGG